MQLVGFIIRIYHDVRSSECEFRWELIDCNPHPFPQAIYTTNKRRRGGNERVVISYFRKLASTKEDGRFRQQSVIHNSHWCMDLLVQEFWHVRWRKPKGVARRSTAAQFNLEFSRRATVGRQWLHQLRTEDGQSRVGMKLDLTNVPRWAQLRPEFLFLKTYYLLITMEMHGAVMWPYIRSFINLCRWLSKCLLFVRQVRMHSRRWCL